MAEPFKNMIGSGISSGLDAIGRKSSGNERVIYGGSGKDSISSGDGDDYVARIWSDQGSPEQAASNLEVPSVYPLNTIPPSLQTGDYNNNAVVPLREPVGLSADSIPSVGDVLKGNINETVLKPLGFDLNREAGLDAWEEESAKRENRPVRIMNMFGEEYDMDGGDNLWLNNQLRFEGNTPTNDTYLRDAVDNGNLSMDDAWAILHKNQVLESLNSEREARESHPGMTRDVYAADSMNNVDDGTKYNYGKMTSDMMTGAQYKHYRDDLGMGGRSGYIDPNEVYSKRQESDEYGFIPFTPDWQTHATMAVENIVDIPARLGHQVANLRQQITPDYQISYDENGEQKTVSGKGFDKDAPAFMNSFYYDRKFNPDKFLSAPTDGSAYTTLVNQFEIPDADGNKTYHYGHLVDVSSVPDGSVQFSFSDGSTVKTTEDFLNSVYDGENIKMTPEVVPLQAALGVVDVNNMAPGKHQAMINESVIPDESGNDTYHYGNLLNVDNGPNGTYSFTFEDGSSVNAPADFFEQVYDKETNNISVPYSRVFVDDIKSDLDVQINPEKQTLENADVRYMPDFVMGDGTRMTLDDVERILMDQTPENDENRKDPNTDKDILVDDDLSYQFHGIPVLENLPIFNGITNRPARLGGQEIFTDKGIDTSNIMNDTLDWTLGSLPISAGKYLPWIYSVSNATRGLHGGVDPNQWNPATNSYSATAGEFDENGNLSLGVHKDTPEGKRVLDEDKSRQLVTSNFLGNAMVPLTEKMVGPIGSHIVPLEKLVDKLPLKSAFGKFLANEGVGAIGEGVEEVLGNIFEEASQYGPDAFASPVIDEDTGEPVHDMYGHEERKKTGAPERIANFLTDTNDNANAFAGGALVDVAMRSLLPGGEHGRTLVGDARAALMQDRARHLTGAPLYVSPEETEDEELRDLGEKYASLFDKRNVAGSER